MDMYADCDINSISEYITQHNRMFDLFSDVYIFGSVVVKANYPNDIDLLLVYEKYSDELQNQLKKISEHFKNAFGLYVDITVLSEEELKQTKFLQRLKNKYQKISINS